MAVLGIIAGGGELPLAVAKAVRDEGRDVFILALAGAADAAVEQYSHAWNSLGEVGRAMQLLRDHRVDEVLLAGKVARPRFSDVKLDFKGARVLPRVLAAARRGDDALLKCMVALFEDEGFRAIGVAEAAPSLLIGPGALGRRVPSESDLADIKVAIEVVRLMGTLDVGQAAAVCEGLVLAVEAAEGTDRMIERVASLPAAIRGIPGKPRGVLVKAPKPQQDGKTDLPVIGIQTVTNAAAAGLAGIAVEAGRTLILGRQEVIVAADRAGLFVYGFSREAVS
jgi:DUF1009 family protein